MFASEFEKKKYLNLGLNLTLFEKCAFEHHSMDSTKKELKTSTKKKISGKCDQKHENMTDLFIFEYSQIFEI